MGYDSKTPLQFAEVSFSSRSVISCLHKVWEAKKLFHYISVLGSKHGILSSNTSIQSYCFASVFYFISNSSSLVKLFSCLSICMMLYIYSSVVKALILSNYDRRQLERRGEKRKRREEFTNLGGMTASPQTIVFYYRMDGVPPRTTELGICRKTYIDSTLSKSMMNMMLGLEEVKHRCMHQPHTLLDMMDHILELQLRT